jgi:hypothetical protein
MQCDLERVKKNAKALEALQRLSEDCGLDHISVNGYSEHVRSTLPDQPKNPATPFIAGGGKVCGHMSNSSQRTPGPAMVTDEIARCVGRCCAHRYVSVAKACDEATAAVRVSRWTNWGYLRRQRRVSPSATWPSRAGRTRR